MKRFAGLLVLLLALTAATAYADNFSILFFPNDGSGDNLIIQKQVAGANILINGGTAPAFFTTFYEPGTTIGGTTEAFLSSTIAQIGGNSFDLNSNGPGALFLSSFTLPTDGKDFSVQVLLRFKDTATSFETGQTFNLSGAAIGHITFQFLNGFYFTDRAGFIQVATVPEPGTLGLLGSGLIAILTLARRQLRL